MKRIIFKKKLDLLYKKLKYQNAELCEFERFFSLNETNEQLLTESEISARDIERERLRENTTACERYYVFHLRKTFNNKWRTQNVEDIVNHWYKNSELIKGLYNAK